MLKQCTAVVVGNKMPDVIFLSYAQLGFCFGCVCLFTMAHCDWHEKSFN